MSFHEPPRQEERVGCRQVWLLTYATFLVVLPVLAALIGVLVAVIVALVLFSVHPALALVPIGLVIGAVVAFATWEERRSRPPEL